MDNFSLKTDAMNKIIFSFLLFCLFFTYSMEILAQGKDADAKIPGTSLAKHTLGESFGGGKIFWLDETGQHGLVAASSDQSAKGLAWNPGKAVATGANSDALYTGRKNSEKIVAVQGTGLQYAARVCIEFTTPSDNVVYKDWYLPSRYELNLLYQQKTVVGGFNLTSGIYWSSTECTTTPETSAWEQEFKFGSQHEDDKDMPDQVRCIRRF